MLGQILLALSLVQAGTINGRLLQPDGNPAVGVRVAAVEAPDHVSLMSVAQTDGNGRYRLENVPPGRYYIQVGPISEPSYYPGTADPGKATVVQVAGSAPLNGFDFSFVKWSNILKTTRTLGTSSTSQFSGTVRAASGVSVLPNVVVVFTNTKSSARFMTSTDKEGAFKFGEIPAAEYVLEFFSPADSGYSGNGYEPLRTSITVNRGEAVSQDIQLRLVMPNASARQQRPDWYAPPPPRQGGVSMGANMAIAVRLIVDPAPPIYSESARQANLKGSVALRIRVGKAGELLSARIQSASTEPVLARAVLDAVGLWHFQPYRRNDEPVEAETTLTFNFPPD